jgi:hypothetical protein
MSTAASKFAGWLIKRSAWMLIEDSERYAEQWLADLEDRRTSLRKLLFAFGIWRASRELSRELEKAPLPPAEAAAAWIIQFKDGPLRIDQRRRFVAWLKESPRHVAAWIRIRQVEQLLHEDWCQEVFRKCQEELDRRTIARTDEGDKG